MTVTVIDRARIAPNLLETDAFLASALRGGESRWPEAWSEEPIDFMLERVAYHGIAGLLMEEPTRLESWPAELTAALREVAILRSMWELRHRTLLAELLGALDDDGIEALLLKGSALAYDLYRNPAARERGDSDLLVDPASLDRVRARLAALGLVPINTGDDVAEDLSSQEGWQLTAEDSVRHVIDLHWRPLNTPAFDWSIKFGDWSEGKRQLSRLGRWAFAPSRQLLLLHACLHRKAHECAPYFVGGRTYYGGDRLVWLNDIALLGREMTQREWADFARIVLAKRFAGDCLDGLAAAESRLGLVVPDEVRRMLEAGRGRTSPYFRSTQLRRALIDLWAIPGVSRKWRYLAARLFPGEGFMRAKYPHMASRPLVLLHGRRLADLVRPRRGRDAR